MIVSIITHDVDPVMNAALRFMESIIGALVAVAVALSASLLFRFKRILKREILEIRRYRNNM